MNERRGAKPLAVAYLSAALKALGHPGAGHDDAALAGADEEARRQTGAHVLDVEAAERLAWFIADYDRTERPLETDRPMPSAGCAAVGTPAR